MDEETLDAMHHLMARTLALEAGLLAVIATHPNPQDLRLVLDAFEQAGLANMQHLPWADGRLDNYRQTVQLLRSKIHAQ